MRTARTIDDARRLLGEARRGGRTVALVPTMGALHEGHLSLLRRAASECDEVVMSLFVNPAQFGPTEDLDAYPRDEQRDLNLAEAAGATLVFAPAVEEIYPPDFSTHVEVADLSETLCGASRGSAHFRGVATIVTKLLNIVAPDVAYFGQKDAQQAAIIRRLVRDLAFAVRIEVCPTVREPDGLAMSSRNSYLGPADRARAGGLNRAIAAVEAAIAAGEHSPDAARRAGEHELAVHEIEPEYLELVSPETLRPVASVDGPVLVAVAARVGPARLIDNKIVNPGE